MLSTSVEIMALLQELNQTRGMTIVLVTHEPDIATFTQRTIRLRNRLITNDERHAARHARTEADMPPPQLPVA